MRANPDKTQVTAFHLSNKEAKRSLKVVWNKTELENTSHPKYLSVTLDRTVCYKQHIHNTKRKVATCNNLLRKLSNSKWGAWTLSYSVAEYAAPVWARSPHAQKLNTELNSACRSVTGCLKPTNVEDLYLLSGIAPPDIRRDVCARMEKTKQEANEAHSLYGQHPAERRLKSHNCFLRSVKPAELSLKIIRCNDWLRRLPTTPHKVTVNLSESLARGYDSPWTTWRCIHRLRTGLTCSREQRQKWGYFEGNRKYRTHDAMHPYCTALLIR